VRDFSAVQRSAGNNCFWVRIRLLAASRLMIVQNRVSVCVVNVLTQNDAVHICTIYSALEISLWMSDYNASLNVWTAWHYINISYWFTYLLIYMFTHFYFDSNRPVKRQRHISENQSYGCFLLFSRTFITWNAAEQWFRFAPPFWKNNTEMISILLVSCS